MTENNSSMKSDIKYKQTIIWEPTMTVNNRQMMGRFLEPEPYTRLELIVIWMIENWSVLALIVISLALLITG